MSGSTASLNFGLLSRPGRLLIVAWFGATLVLGTWGYADYAVEIGADPSIGTALYHCAQLFVLHAPHFEHRPPLGLEIARWSAALFFATTVFQIARQLFPNEFAALRYRRFRNHVIIAGLGRRAVRCARCERTRKGRKRNVVVIDRNPAEQETRECLAVGAHVITGNATDPRVLRAAGIRRAAELWALCPEDSVNCETAVQAEAVLEEATPRRGDPLRCNVHLSDIDLRVELQRHAGAAVAGSPVTLQFFDLYDREARQVLHNQLPIDHDGIRADEPRRPHLVILGFGRMGRSMALRAAKLGHFANRVDDPSRRLRISVIDRIGAQNEGALLFRYPEFREVCDLSTHSMDLETLAARKLVEEWCADPTSLTSLVVCFDDQSRAVEVALRLLPGIRSDAVRVAVRVAHREGLGTLMERVWGGNPGGAGVRITSFGRLDEGCCETALQDTLEESLAKAIHHDFVAHRLEEAERSPADRSLLPWPLLDEDLRESNRQQADHIAIKLRAIGADIASASEPAGIPFQLTEDEIELLARLEHIRWSAERRLAGWTRAPRDVARRTSPYLCDWAELPESIREYDRVAVRSIPRLLEAAGLRPVRRVG